MHHRPVTHALVGHRLGIDHLRVGQHRNEDLHIGLAAPSAHRQRLAREVRQAPQPRLVVKAHLRLGALALEAFVEQGAKAAVAVGRRALRPGLVAVLDPELASRHAGASALALATQLLEHRLPVGLHAAAIARHTRIQPRAKPLVVQTGGQRPGQPRRRRPFENVRDGARAHPYRGRGLGPRQPQPVPVLKDLLDLHRANPPHRGLCLLESIQRSIRQGRERIGTSADLDTVAEHHVTVAVDPRPDSTVKSRSNRRQVRRNHGQVS